MPTVLIELEIKLVSGALNHNQAWTACRGAQIKDPDLRLPTVEELICLSESGGLAPGQYWSNKGGLPNFGGGCTVISPSGDECLSDTKALAWVILVKMRTKGPRQIIN